VSSELQTSEKSSVHTPEGHRIVVGIDGSPASLSALEWAAHQAEITDASLEIVASWEWPTSFGWSLIPEGYDPASDLQKMIDRLLVNVRAAHPVVSIAAKIVEGHPAPVLIKESKGAELLVVGSRGHGEFIGMLIGSTSEHCVANASCPVVVFRGNA
jgi:nucleotide-binding universal stress UspA family protein